MGLQLGYRLLARLTPSLQMTILPSKCKIFSMNPIGTSTRWRTRTESLIHIPSDHFLAFNHRGPNADRLNQANEHERVALQSRPQHQNYVDLNKIFEPTSFKTSCLRLGEQSLEPRHQTYDSIQQAFEPSDFKMFS